MPSQPLLSSEVQTSLRVRTDFDDALLLLRQRGGFFGQFIGLKAGKIRGEGVEIPISCDSIIVLLEPRVAAPSAAN